MTYHDTARRLKPLVEKAKFTPEQLSIVNKLMRGCWALRSGDLCSNLLRMALPDDMEIVQDREHPKIFKTRRGDKTYYPMYVIRKGDPIPQPKTEISVGTCEVCKNEKSVAINGEGLEVCANCGGIEEDAE